MRKNWTNNLTKKSGAAAEFLKPFGESKVEPQDNKNDNVNINDDVNESGGDYLDSILEGGKKKKDELILTGLYLQEDLAKILDRLGKKGGRGAKSRIANDALRKYFAEKGLL